MRDDSEPALTSRPGARLLAFGLLLCFLSSFGQTFFIGLFGAEIRAQTGLSNSLFGLVYSLATLTSAAIMMVWGGLVDRLDRRLFAVAAMALLAAGTVALPLVGSALLLGLALLALRLGGQGLLTHIGLTTMAQSFSRNRGRAVALAAMGHPLGEALLPPLAVLLLVFLAWQTVWWLATAVLILAMAPVIWLLSFGDAALPTGRKAMPAGAPALSGFTRAQVLRDRRFYALLPAAFTPGFIVTGVLFHQIPLVEEKGWELAWFAGTLAVYGGASILGTLISGPVIDRIGANRLTPFHLLPLGLACLALALIDQPLVAVPFMAGAGVTGGIAATVNTAMWAEIYGTAHLGAIRSVAMAVMVTSTAAAPVLFGVLLDHTVGMAAILLGCVVWTGFAMVTGALALAAWRRQRSPDAG